MNRIKGISITRFEIHFQFQGTYYKCGKSKHSIKKVGHKLGMEWYEMDELCRALQEQQEKNK